MNRNECAPSLWTGFAGRGHSKGREVQKEKPCISRRKVEIGGNPAGAGYSAYRAVAKACALGKVRQGTGDLGPWGPKGARGVCFASLDRYPSLRVP